MTKAFISGCEGTKLSQIERDFFETATPWGLILFARNCETPEQIKALVDDFRACVGRANAPVLIDQEGGRVQRLRPPHWRAYPPGRIYGALEAAQEGEGIDAAREISQLIAAELIQIGINVDCLPIIDVAQPDVHDVIGDRAYSNCPDQVGAIGRAVCEGLLAGGVLPILKHIPGHGRVHVDSHFDLPVVDAPLKELRASDFKPFKALNDIPMAMTAHIIYSAIDKDLPATQSKTVIGDIIRGEIGFDGLLMTDDLSMQALSGSFGERAEKSLQAGCDMVLHCNGKMDEMGEVAAVVPKLSGDGLRRADAALACLREPAPINTESALATLERAKLVA
ncbi:MAG: beta-N-acetylhexosaminidase [Hyphomicrobiales bacterium]